MKMKKSKNSNRVQLLSDLESLLAPVGFKRHNTVFTSVSNGVFRWLELFKSQNNEWYSLDIGLRVERVGSETTIQNNGDCDMFTDIRCLVEADSQLWKRAMDFTIDATLEERRGAMKQLVSDCLIPFLSKWSDPDMIKAILLNDDLRRSIPASITWHGLELVGQGRKSD